MIKSLDKRMRGVIHTVHAPCLFLLLLHVYYTESFWNRDEKKSIGENRFLSNSQPIDVPIDLKFYSDESISSSRDFPSTGFISGTIIGLQEEPFLFKTIQRVDQFSFPCDTIQFTHTPDPNPSPFVNGPVFKLLPTLYNHKFAWYNGHEYLSFVDNSDFGTWIVGVNPGQDSGYVFLRPDSMSLVPVNLESEEVSWSWLSGSAWKEESNAKVVCRENQEEPKIKGFYTIEYFDITNHSPQISYFISQGFSTEDSPSTESVEGMFYDVIQNTWKPLKQLKIVAAKGGPNLLRENSKSPITIGHLVNEEHSGNGWRFTYRYATGFNITRNELSFTYNRYGPSNDIRLSLLSPSQLDAYYTNMHNSLSRVSIGNYIWLWFTIDSKDTFVSEISDISPGKKMEQHDEILLECIQVIKDTAVFVYYPSDRVNTMRQTILSRDTNYVIMKRSDLLPSRVTFTLGNVELKVLGGYNIGSDIISFIKQHLKEKEGILGDMSSCYMYHAAVSLPRPLVYAAEIICVLIGSKPLTMIQYVTPTDHQWKFPYVQKLTRGIVSSMHLHLNKLDINVTVFTMVADKTLIIYRPNRKYLVDALRPFGQAQALHPGPYPDSENLKKSLQEQIYNAYWNGYVLGYPTYFIESYCMSFHSDLSQDEKAEQVRIARIEVERYFTDRILKPIQISSGLDPPVPEIIWNYL